MSGPHRKRCGLAPCGWRPSRVHRCAGFCVTFSSFPLGPLIVGVFIYKPCLTLVTHRSPYASSDSCVHISPDWCFWPTLCAIVDHCASPPSSGVSLPLCTPGTHQVMCYSHQHLRLRCGSLFPFCGVTVAVCSQPYWKYLYQEN